MTKNIKAVTVYDIQIIDGKPVRTPINITFYESNCVQQDSGLGLYPSDAIQQESAQLNKQFNQGYF